MRHERHTHLLKSMQINTNSKLNTKHIYRFLQIKKQALFQKYTVRFHEKKTPECPSRAHKYAKKQDTPRFDPLQQYHQKVSLVG